MPQFGYTPTAGEVGGAPSGFIGAGGGGTFAAYSVVDAGDGRYAIRFSGGDFAATLALVWDGNGNPPAFADGEAYMRLRHRLDGSELGMFMRASGANPNWTSGTFAAYWARLRIYGTDALTRYREYDGGVSTTEIDSASPAWGALSSAVNVDLHLMLKVAGSTIEFKAWKEGSSEPGYSSTTDSTNNTASLLRLFFSNEMDTDLYFIGVGTAGDPAPRGGAPSTDLTGNVTAADAAASGSLATGASVLAGDVTTDAAAPTGTLGLQFSTVASLPFTRNPGNGGRLVNLPNIAVAVLTDDANLARLAGSTSLLMAGDGRVTFANGVPVPPGSSVILLTREPGLNGALGVDRLITS